MFSASSGRSKIAFQDLTRLHESIAGELRDAFEQVLAKSAFVQGPFVAEFEKNFADFTGARHCLGVANGTDALEIALEAAGVGQGDVVAVPSMTFAATAEAVVRCGGVPLFVDCDAETLCMTSSTLESAIVRSGKLPAAVMPVHLYGRACDIDDLIETASRHGANVFEDCAQAHAAKQGGRHVGLAGMAGTFSFYPGKNLGALGDAGAIVTQSSELYERMKKIRDHGRSQKYVHESVGRNSRLDGLQAAFLSVKLRHLEKWTAKRRELASLYRRGLQGLSAVRPLSTELDPSSHAHHLFVVRVPLSHRGGRDGLAAWLSERGIETGVHYPHGTHQQKAFERYAPTGGLPVTELAAREILSLPFDPLMSAAEVEAVCAAIRSFDG